MKSIGSCVNIVDIKKDDIMKYFSAQRMRMGLKLHSFVTVFATIRTLLARLAGKNEYTKENSPRFLQTLIDTIPNPIFYKDDQGKFLGSNKSFEEITGISRQTLFGKSVFDIAPPHLAEIYHAADQELFREQGVQFHEVSVPYPDGTLHDVIISMATFPPVDGAPGGLVGTMLDISERKRGEEKTLQTLSLLSATLDATADAILVTNLEGRIVAYNRQFTEMWHIPGSILDTELETQILQRILGQLKHPDEYDALVKGQIERPELESHSVLEFTDGRVFERHSKPQRISDEIVGRVRSYRDISEQRKLEAQLRHSQKMESVGTLAGGVAHDFNNTLTAIIGYGVFMKMSMEQDDQFRPVVENILLAADRAAELTRLLLAFGREQTLELCSADLNDMIRGIETLLLRFLREDIELRVSFTDEACRVMADERQIEKVIMSLVTNARDALVNGGIISIDTSTTDLDRNYIRTHGYGEPGRYVLLTVSDSGVGMDEAMRLRIYEPFFTTKEVGKGTGLGLSVAYGIIKQHNGYINCYSEPGKGTTFRIYLPSHDTSTDEELERPVELNAWRDGNILLA